MPPGNKKHKPPGPNKKKANAEPDNVKVEVNITIEYNIGNKEIHIEQRAEGGGQIIKDVGMNANQGGQNARDNSETANIQSQFADGNGRSGIAGNDNDEAGGQQGIKVRDSLLINSKIKSISDHAEASEGNEPDMENQE